MNEVKVSELIKSLHTLTAKSIVFTILDADTLLDIKHVFFDSHAILLPIFKSDSVHTISKNMTIYFNNSSAVLSNYIESNINLDEEGNLYLLVLFDSEIATEFVIQQHVELRYENNANSGYSIQGTLLKDYVEQMTEWLNSGISISKQVIIHKFKELLLILLGRFSINYFKFMLGKNAHIANVQTIIDMNLSKNISVEELARKTHKSLSTFKREFDKVYGMPPATYIRKKRLEAAARSLLLGKKASDIYEDFGYETVSNFIYAFKKHFNQTPKEFSKKNGVL